MSDVATTMDIKRFNDLDTVLMVWEDRVRQLDRELDERVSNTMTAVITPMLPTMVQSFVYQRRDDRSTAQGVLDRTQAG